MDFDRNKNDGGAKDDVHLSQLASVGQVAAGIVHEVRNPLTVVKGFLQLLEQEQENKYVAIAQSELDHALNTLNNLLQVSKPDLEDEDFQTINLTVELESILHLFHGKLYDIKVITDFKNNEVTIFGKKNQFKKALFNIVKNAIEAMDGKGTLSVTHELVDHEVVITIQDTGVGIPNEKLSLIGTPFFTTKDQGTGMGLPQVFSVIYQHGGKVFVDSKEGRGTTFVIKIPNHEKIKNRGVKKLDLHYEDLFSMIDFMRENKEKFEQRLLAEAMNVKEQINDIQKIGNIDLLKNAFKLISYVIEDREHELVAFAKQEGIAWAKYSLTLAFKLEWVQSIRRTLWDFYYNFDLHSREKMGRDEFFTLEKKVNEMIDQFLTYFFISYSNYKDHLIHEQKELVEDLSVPIIPINETISVLPLIGNIDGQRHLTIQEKVLQQIEMQRIETLIIDFSGIVNMDEELIYPFMNAVNGFKLMGVRTVITGLRAEIVKKFANSDQRFHPKLEFKGTLQLALNDEVFHVRNSNLS